MTSFCCGKPYGTTSGQSARPLFPGRPNPIPHPLIRRPVTDPVYAVFHSPQNTGFDTAAAVGHTAPLRYRQKI